MAICLATSLGNGSTPFAVKGRRAKLAPFATRRDEDEGCGNWPQRRNEMKGEREEKARENHERSVHVYINRNLLVLFLSLSLALLFLSRGLASFVFLRLVLVISSHVSSGMRLFPPPPARYTRRQSAKIERDRKRKGKGKGARLDGVSIFATARN